MDRSVELVGLRGDKGDGYVGYFFFGISIYSLGIGL